VSLGPQGCPQAHGQGTLRVPRPTGVSLGPWGIGFDGPQAHREVLYMSPGPWGGGFEVAEAHRVVTKPMKRGL